MRKIKGKLRLARRVLKGMWVLRKADAARGVRVWGKLFIRPSGTIRIGPRCRIAGDVAATEIGTSMAGVIDIGTNVFINYGCSISAQERVTIGDDCLIGSHVIIGDSDYHELDPARRYEKGPSAPVTLERNVWLSNRVIVTKGITIGENSVVAAGSTVTKDIPANQVWGGVPAKFLRDL